MTDNLKKSFENLKNSLDGLYFKYSSLSTQKATKLDKVTNVLAGKGSKADVEFLVKLGGGISSIAAGLVAFNMVPDGVPEKFNNFLTCLKVKVSCRLISKDNCRIISHCTGNGNALLLAA